MEGTAWAWAFFSVYLVFTACLAWRGGSKTGSNDSFAIGDGQMSPLVAGTTLGACLASSAMFVIMPGFVYADGLSALIGFSVPLIAGLAFGLLVLGPRFQDIGAQVNALTIPHWLGERYRSDVLRRLFSGLNILNIAYLVLVAVGCAYVMQAALGLSYHASVLLIVCFVFGYTGFGGAFAHAFTNTMQGAIMLVMAIIIFGSGLHLWADGSLTADLLSTGFTAEGSPLFSTAAEVWLVPFVMGAALTTQPHLLTKALYVKDRRALAVTTAVAMGTFCVFSLVLFAGAYARLTLPVEVAQDKVMAAYLASAFASKPLSAAVTVAILAASMSTLDGLLVAISASVGNDLLPGKGSVALNRTILAALALITIAIAWSPPTLVLILGQLGVYGLVSASAGPLVAGLFLRGPLPASAAIVAALTALGIHFGLALSGLVTNPGVSAAAALVVSVPIAVVLARVGASRRALPIAAK